MEWWVWLLILGSVIGLLLMTALGYVAITEYLDHRRRKAAEVAARPQHHLDYQEDWNVQTLIYCANKMALRVEQHSEWDRQYGPPYYYENKEAEFLQLEEDGRPWLTDVQIRSIKRNG